MFPHHYSLIWWVVVYIPHTEITHNKKILILSFVRALYWWLETQSPKFVQTSLQSRLNFFHSCMGISSYKVWWMIFYVIKGSSCETWSGIWAFLAIYYYFVGPWRPRNPVVVIFKSGKPCYCVCRYCNHLALTMLFLMQGQCSYSNFIWLELKNLVNIKCSFTSCIIPLIKRKKRDPQLLLCWNTWPSLDVSTDQK